VVSWSACRLTIRFGKKNEKRELDMATQSPVEIKEIRSITVDRPPEEVFAFLTDAASVPQWSSVVTEVHSAPAARSIDVGTRVKAQLRLLGIKFSVEGEVVELDRKNRRAILRTKVAGGGSVESHLSVEPVNGASLVVFDERIVPPGWIAKSGLSKAFIARAVEASTDATLRNIRNLLEGGELAKVRAALASAPDEARSSM
jgi:carbon monoxide dehydrogenase subunit G